MTTSLLWINLYGDLEEAYPELSEYYLDLLVRYMIETGERDPSAEEIKICVDYIRNK